MFFKYKSDVWKAFPAYSVVINSRISRRKRMKKQPSAAVQCLSVDKRISTLIKDIKQSRQPLAIEAVNKLEEAQHLLESLRNC